MRTALRWAMQQIIYALWMKKIHQTLRITYGDMTFTATDKFGMRIGWNKCNSTVILSFIDLYGTLEMGFIPGRSTGLPRSGIPPPVRGI
jgi:hypothetical protein